MNLKNKTDDELWELYQGMKVFPAGIVVTDARQNILQEIIRRERDNG